MDRWPGVREMLTPVDHPVCMAEGRIRPGSRRQPRRGTDPSVTGGSITVGGIERTFLVRPGPTPHSPLLFVLHGGGGQGRGMAGLGGIATRAAAAGFATAFPDGQDRGWNDGRSGARISQRAGADDVGFLVGLIDHLAQTGVADPTRVFSCGISNGAFMSDRLARSAPDRVSAIGLVAGGAGVDALAEGHPGGRPIPVMMFHGDADPIVPYAGGRIGFHGPAAERRAARRRRRAGRVRQRGGAGPGVGSPPDADRGLCAGAEQVAADWAALAGGGPSPTVERLAAPGADLGVVRLEWRGPTRVPVVLHRIEGGGHTWPGGPQYLPARIIGPTATTLDATGLLLSFFSWTAGQPRS